MAMEMTYSCAHGDPGENRSRPYDLLLGPEAGEVHGYCLVFAAILPHLFDLRRSIKLAVAMLETERVSSGAGRIGSNSGVRSLRCFATPTRPCGLRASLYRAGRPAEAAEHARG